MIHLIVYAVAGASLAIAGSRAASAYHQRIQGRDQLTRVSQQAAELGSLRRSAPDSGVAPLPDSGLATRVTDAMSRAGLSSSMMQSLSPESETGERGVVRQHATLVLTGITLPKLGKFVESWREREPWIISGLDLAPAGPASPGSDLPLRVVMTLDGVFKDGKSSHPLSGARR